MYRHPRHNDDIFELIADIVIARQSEWRNRAACNEDDKAVFFSHDGVPNDEVAAKAICRNCRVIQQCRADFEQMPVAFQGHGVWFGTTPAERRRQRFHRLR